MLKDEQVFLWFSNVYWLNIKNEAEEKGWRDLIYVFDDSIIPPKLECLPYKDENTLKHLSGIKMFGLDVYKRLKKGELE